MKDYTVLLESLLVMEFHKSPERAKELIKENPNVVVQGIMAGNMSLRGCAMALDHVDLAGAQPAKPA